MKKILAMSFILASFVSIAEDKKIASDLESKLESLSVPSDKVTPLISEDKLYSVNSRYSSLNKRFELTMFGANNFNADSHINTTQRGTTARFHWNDRWSLGYRYTDYFNELSSAGKKVFREAAYLPDTDYALKSSEGFVNFNTIYGKLRFTKDTIVYFDQYISLGYGTIGLAGGETKMYSVDLGFAFWMGRYMSARFGVKSESYTQKKLKGQENVHNAMGYLELGYLFGEGSRI